MIDRYKQNQSLELLQRPIRLLSEALKSDSRLGSSFYAGLEKALCKTKQHKLAEEIFKVLDFFKIRNPFDMRKILFSMEIL